MTDHPILSRRLFLAGTSAAALVPVGTLAQTTGPSRPAFAAACRTLSGFDTIPDALLNGAMRALPARTREALATGTAEEDGQQALLGLLYTGMHAPKGAEPERHAYAEALMFAAVEDSLNVPSYCGGLPGYWAEKPVGA